MILIPKLEQNGMAYTEVFMLLIQVLNNGDKNLIILSLFHNDALQLHLKLDPPVISKIIGVSVETA